jgi:hypothetical protein
MLEFITDSLKQAERCLCIGARRDIAELTSILSRRPFDSTLLHVREPEQWCAPNRPLAPETITGVMDQWSTATFGGDQGGRGRVIADMTWTAARSSRPSIGDLVQMERGVTQWARTNPQIAVSMYDVEIFGAAIVTTFVGAHPKVWVCGVPVENPYAGEADPTAGPPTDRVSRIRSRPGSGGTRS